MPLIEGRRRALDEVEEAASEHRHRDEANPYTFFERLRMIRDTVIASPIPLDRVMLIPFPINLPDRWRYYLPPGVVHYLRVFSEWEQTKVERLRAAGYEVEVLQPGVAKAIEASEVRARLARGAPWAELVPPPVAQVMREIAESAAS